MRETAQRSGSQNNYDSTEECEGDLMREESIVVGRNTEYPLNGRIVLPATSKQRYSAVVFVHGSGSSNMDEKVFRLTPFRDLAEGLAARGIASIRYDKRSFVHAKKMMKQTITVREETIEDALRATELLRSHPNIDPDRVFIVGHSMGAMLAPRIDAEGGDYRGLILMAGSPYRLEDIFVRQVNQSGGSAGIMKLIAGLEDKIFSKKFDGLYEMPDEEAKKKKFGGGTTLYYFKEAGQKTAVDYLAGSEKPVLIMQGGMDFQCLADVDYEGFRELLKDRKNTEFRLYEDLNHIFVKGIYNDISKAMKEYRVEQHIGDEVIDDIAEFIKKCE